MANQRTRYALSMSVRTPCRAVPCFFCLSTLSACCTAPRSISVDGQPHHSSTVGSLRRQSIDVIGVDDRAFHRWATVVERLKLGLVQADCTRLQVTCCIFNAGVGCLSNGGRVLLYRSFWLFPINTTQFISIIINGKYVASGAQFQTMVF